MRDRLIKILSAFPVWGKTLKDQWFDKAIERLADHLLANGVIVLPVGIGQTVWFFSGVLEEVCKAKVVKIEINLYTNPMLWFEFEYSSELIGTHVIKGRIDEFLGKTVFLTKEEAEKALAERSGE